MAVLVSAKCPHCGAPVQVPPDVDHVICGYCRHGSSIQRGRPSSASPQQGPVIHIPRTPNPALAVYFVVLGSVLVLGAVLRAVMTRDGFGLSSLGSQVFFGDHPFLFDVNGDGIQDVVGMSELPTQSTWFAAYDGRDGKEIWRTDAITKDFAHGFRGMAGELFVTVDNLGKVQAYNAKTGQPAWASLVSDEGRRMYLGDGFVRIQTQDDQSHDLALTTGQKLPERAAIPARSIPATRMHSGFGYRTVSRIDFRRLGLTESIEGMRPEIAVVLDTGKRAFVIGEKSSGTSVPMIAAVDGKEVIWTSIVPAVDPLSTSTFTTQAAALFGNRIAIPYRLKSADGVRMAVFDTETGKRLWDVSVHGKAANMRGIAMSKESVFLATWSAVYALNADTGELRFRLGPEG